MESRCPSVAKLGLLGRLLGIGPPPRRVMSTRPKNSDLVKIGQKSVKLGQKSDKLGQTRAYSVLLGPTRSNSANSVKIGQTRSKGQNCHKKRKKSRISRLICIMHLMIYYLTQTCDYYYIYILNFQ